MNHAISTKTATALLAGLLNPENAVAWNEFQQRYVPIMRSFALKLGLNDADADDVTQDALVRFVRDYRAGKYDRERGRLRSWLVGIVKYRVADFLRSRAMHPQRAGSSAMANLPDDDALDKLWEAEERRTVLCRAFATLRERSKLADKTIRAFERFVFDELPAATVAAELEMAPHDVYVARSRVFDRLQSIISEIQSQYQDT
ncbi:MAG: sigma-70 family RNA polymerase sigma factor [Phycisphaerales bacterium]|nr:sigma-70 family RNA polymerase sigma factor [Phycisphaerales bacterium]